LKDVYFTTVHTSTPLYKRPPIFKGKIWAKRVSHSWKVWYPVKAHSQMYSLVFDSQ